ncbi:hypothetical protein KU392_02440 [Advenella alkanexedens]|mgnify:CR=1 FL=1|uniref:Uncharacterized protein n=1 Tax=Advenella alkanexedens TaxID=1481665 RepID=A0ABS6NKF0_9BURK|nr:hypothetical protein [Advenella alkanexedens]MBV4396114.1 hypothetical protein [Advenella alkanexedens]
MFEFISTNKILHKAGFVLFIDKNNEIILDPDSMDEFSNWALSKRKYDIAEELSGLLNELLEEAKIFIHKNQCLRNLH